MPRSAQNAMDDGSAQANGLGTVKDSGNKEESKQNSPAALRTPDEVLDAFGPRNPYLLLIWVTMGACWALSAMPIMASTFFMDQPCEIDHQQNATGDVCHVADRQKSADDCDQQMQGTITKEFNLTANDNASVFGYTQLSTSMYLVGDVFGSLSLPQISDRFGRHPVLCASMFFCGLFGCLSGFVPFIQLFIAFRFLQGVFWPGIGITNWVLAYESIPMRLRAYTMMVFGLWWAFGYCMVGPMAALLPNWRWLVIVASAPSLVVGILYYFTLPESLHWLASYGDQQRVQRWLSRANKSARWVDTPQVFNLSIRRFCADNLHRCHPNRQIVQSATGTNVATETSPDPIKSSRSPNPDGPSATVTVAMASGESDSKATTATYGSIDPARAVQQQQQSLKRTRRRSESPFISTTTSGGLNVAEGMAERKEEKRKRWLRQRRRLIIYNVFFAYLWTCNTFIYYGLSLFSTKLAGNIYWNFVLVGAMEIPSYIVSPYLLDKLGRRWFVALSHFLATCSYCAIVINDLSSSLGFGPRCPSELVTLLMWLLGKFAISCSFTSLFVYASEVFPTVSRTTSIGICVSTSRIGACLVPIVQKISREWQLGSFGIAALLATFVTLLLPETRNKLLPASSAEVPKKSAELARQQSVVPVPSSTAASTT